MSEGESHQGSMKSRVEFKGWGPDSNSTKFEKAMLGLVNARRRQRREPQTVLEFLKAQQVRQDLKEENEFRKALHEKLNRLSGEAAGGQDEMGRQRLTLLQVLLLILAASLSVPVNAAETVKETQKQAA